MYTLVHTYTTISISLFLCSFNKHPCTHVNLVLGAGKDKEFDRNLQKQLTVSG